jgi:hypothetical protein
MAQPILDLPIQYQTLNIDIEPVAQMRQFGADAYDVANWVATIAVNSPADQEYELVLPFAIESGTRAEIAVVSSTNEDFDTVERFKKPGGKPDQFIPYLQKMGLLASGESTLTPELNEFVKGFKTASLRIPAGQHILRLHASQKLKSTSEDKRAYRLIMYAPLCSFVVGGGQVNLTAIVTLPPEFQAPVQVTNVTVEPLPGQPMPGEGSPAALPVQAANNKVYAWHFRNDPKITIDYRY